MGYSFGDVYRPCECGSGRKYKFCCLTKDREEIRGREPERGIPPWLGTRRLIAVDLDESKRLFEEGLALVESGEGRQGIPFLERSIRLAPFIPQPHNNLALAHFMEGEVEKAIRIAERVYREIDPGNTYALGSLYHFHIVLGDREEADRILDRIARSTPRDGYGVFKMCEAFARARKHEEVLKASSNPLWIEVGPPISFFRGTALANLGRYDEARPHIAEGRLDPMHGDRAKRYLRLIDRGIGPQTLDGDWSYLEALEWIPRSFLKRIETDERARSFPGMVHALVAMLNDDPAKGDVPVKMLGALATPEAREVLRKVAFGTFGTEEVRMKALFELQKLDEVRNGDEVEVWHDEGWRGVRTQKVEVTDEAVSFIPAGLEDAMGELVEALRAKDWSRAERIGRGLVEKAPDCPMALNNLATAVHGRGRREEAEALLRKAMDLDPSYLFAAASLISFLLASGRAEEAREVLKKAVVPPKVHPDAYVSYLIACSNVACTLLEFDGAMNVLKMAKDIDPDSEAIEREIRFVEDLR
jgi:tetratricopeptide (TPR) repeat protein